jgi:pyrroloquinoline quinone biosynthesis protein B
MGRTVYILGSGQDGGLPQFGARGATDMKAHVDVSRRRLGPSICVLGDNGTCLLIDVSPDIKEQESRLLQLPAYAARENPNPFDAVLLTHAHVGHYAGLVHFGREAANTSKLPVHCTARMADFLRGNAPWEQLVSLGNIELRDGAPAGIRVFPVPHRGEYTDTLGVSIGNKLLYVPDIDDWRQWPDARAEVERHEICLLDGTFFSPDELPGRDLSEISHPFIADTLEFFGDLAASRRLILTHFNHSNPVCDPTSPEAATVRAAGFELATEMQAIAI